MKKIFNNIFLWGLTLTMSSSLVVSCDDVPAPYELITNIDGGVTGDQTSSKDAPFTVEQAMAAYKASKTGNQFVKGYIVGYLPANNSVMSAAQFCSADTAAQTNLVLAATAGETSTDNCMAVQLPAGEIRTALNVKDHADNIGKEVLLYGSIEKYCGAPGIKTVTYCEIDGKSYGKEPGKEEPIGDVKGKGTADDPFNVAAAITKCKATGETATTEKFYVKGIAKSVDANNVDQYKNITIDLVDVPTSSVVFKAYRIKYYNGADFNSQNAAGIKAGDTIVVVGNLVNYKNNTPETTAGASLVSVNGKSEGGNGGNDDGGNTTTVDPKGVGSAADPFNVAAAIAKCIETDTVVTADAYYVEGLVKSVDASGAAQYGNLTLDMVDVEGSTVVFKAFRVVPENGKFAGTEIKVGDKVLVKGNLVNYKSNTPETVANSLVVKVNGSALSVKPTILAAASTNVDWDKTSAKISISVVNAADGGVVTATSLTAGATCAVESDGLAVTLPSQNTTDANIEYEFKLSYPGAADVTIKVVQKKKPAEGEEKLMTSSLTWTNGTNAYNDNKGTVNGTPVEPIFKLSTSKAGGNATVTIPAGATKVVFYAVAWKGASATLKVGDKEVAVSGNDGATNTSPFTLTVTDDDYYEVDVTAGDVVFSCEKRVLIFGLNAK